MFKSGMKKLAHTSLDVEDKISLFLMQYHTTPNCTTGQTPSDLFLNRCVCTRLDFLLPNAVVAVCRKQYMLKLHHDQQATDRFFSADDYLHNMAGGRKKWIPGVIVELTGPVSYKVRVGRPGATAHFHYVDTSSSESTPTIQGLMTPPTRYEP